MMIFSIFRGAVLIEPRMPEMPVEIMPVAIILIHGCMAGRFVPIIVVFVISRLRCRLSRRFRGLLSFVSLRFLLSFSLMVVASRFEHTPEIASLDTFEEVESVPGEDGDASGDAGNCGFLSIARGV